MPSPLKFGFGGWSEKPLLWKYKHFRNKFLARLPSDSWFKKRFKPPEFTIYGDGLDNTLYYEIESNLSAVFIYYAKGLDCYKIGVKAA